MATGNARSIFDGPKATIWPSYWFRIWQHPGHWRGEEPVHQPITGRAEVHRGRPAAGIPCLSGYSPLQLVPRRSCGRECSIAFGNGYGYAHMGLVS